MINTAEETSCLVKKINHPNYRMMIDVKAALRETREQKLERIIKKYKDYIEHFHVNDISSAGPGFGDTNLGTIINTLRFIQYKKYISVEVFTCIAGAENIARVYLRKYQVLSLKFISF